MYRTSDAALAGTVNQRRADGDIGGMVAAATELWLSQPEPGTPFDDPLELEVWHNVVTAGAVGPAVRAGVELMRERQRLRPRAFLHLVQCIRSFHDPGAGLDADYDQPFELMVPDAELLLEIADLVREEGWPADPYLGMVFVKLIEGRAKRLLWPYMKEHLTWLRSDTAAWVLVSLLASSTSLTLDLDEWLVDLPRRTGLPDWMAWLYTRHVREQAPEPQVWAAVAPDEGGADTDMRRLDLSLEDALRKRQWDAFSALLAAAPGHLERDPAQGISGHPVLRYINRFKDGHRVTVRDFEYNEPIGLVASAQHGVRVNQGVVDLCEEMGAALHVHVTAFRLFRDLLAMEGKDGARVLALWREFRAFPKSKALSWATPAWEAAVKTRSRWTTRLRYAFFG